MKLTSYILLTPVKVVEELVKEFLYTEDGNLRCWWKNQTHNWNVKENSLRRKTKRCTKCGEKRSRHYTHPAV